MQRRDFIKLIATSTLGAAPLSLPAGHVHAEDREDDDERRGILQRDVCIVGGGAAGTYAAVRLRDLGHSVVVIEKSDRLGGHCQTFVDPGSGAPIDIGVVVFPDNALVRGYFGRFGVPLITPPAPGGATLFVDFRSGQPFTPFEPSPLELGTALTEYVTILQGMFPFLDREGYQLPGPGPLLNLLTLPMRSFIERFPGLPVGLINLLPLFARYEQGFGFLPDATALYILKNLSGQVVSSILGGSFLVAPTGAEGPYQGAAALLGADVLLDAGLVAVQRRGRERARVVVHTPRGRRIISAAKLLVTAPPLPGNLAPFDLDPLEAGTFSRLSTHYYATALARIDNMPPGALLVNRSPETLANVPALPGIYGIDPTPVPGLFSVKYGGDRGPLSDRWVKARIAADINRLADLGGGRPRFRGFEIFKSHHPFALEVSPADIRAGFYRTLQSLQGRHNTFYAGATHQTHSSAAVWAYVESLLPALTP